MPWHVATAADSYRPATEDRLGAWPTAYGYLLAVADGVGGRAGGAAAAEFALGGIAAYAPWPVFPSPNALANLLRQIDLDTATRPDVGETTAAVCSVTGKGLSGAAVGDSAAWWVTDAGVIDLITGARPKPWVGSGAARPAPFAAPIGPGTFLLMTDGVWKYADREALGAIARGDDLSAVPGRLIDAARLRSGQLQDDAAVIAARFRVE
jgi:serine/threonine protein phosphatase PrpC